MLNRDSTTAPTPLPSISVFFPMESRKHGRQEREERADSYTPRLHPDKQAGCDCSAHLGLWLENSPKPCSSDVPLCLKGCCEHEISLCLAIKPKQLTVRLTPFSIGIALCCCIDKLTVGAWACNLSYCCWGNFPGSDLQWPPDLAGQGQDHCAVGNSEVEAGRNKAFATNSFTYLKIRELEKRSNQERLESTRTV